MPGFARRLAVKISGVVPAVTTAPDPSVSVATITSPIVIKSLDIIMNTSRTEADANV